MKCYYIVRRFTNRGWTDRESFLECGIYLDRNEAEKYVEFKNDRYKKEWERLRAEVVKKLERKQLGWDVLHAAGISEGERPELDRDYKYNTEWRPGLGGEYYCVEEAELHLPSGKIMILEEEEETTRMS